jgi:hypothetical protein
MSERKVSFFAELKRHNVYKVAVACRLPSAKGARQVEEG